MHSVSKVELGLIAVLGAVLFASALALVEIHYRTRLLFVAQERAVDLERRLMDDQAELQMKVRRAALPGTISAGAVMMGLEGATGNNTYTFVEEPDGRIVFSRETQARLEEAEAYAAQEAAKAAALAAKQAEREAKQRERAERRAAAALKAQQAGKAKPLQEARS